MTSKSRYDALLNEICVDLGFCGSCVDGEPLHVDQLIPNHGTLSADEFVDFVLMAEGLDPAKDALEHRTSLRNAFVRRMAAEAVDVRELR